MKLPSFARLFSSDAPPATPKASRRPSTPSAQASAHPSQQKGSRPYYEALSKEANRAAVPSSVMALSPWIASLNRAQLASIARWLYDNHPMVGYAVNLIADYTVPVKPQASTADLNANEQYEAYFEEWAKVADFTGRFSFADLQRIVSIALDTDGDIGVVLTEEGGFPQVQLVSTFAIGEASLLSPTTSKSKSGVLKVDGVNIDSAGRVLSYDIQQPDQKIVAVPSASMLLVYEPERFNAYRGLSPLRRGSNDARDASEIKAFEKLAVKVHSAILVALKNEAGEIEENEWGDDEADANAPSATASTAEKRIGIADFFGGDIPILPDGTSLASIENNRGSPNVIGFLDALVGSFVASLDLPPSFFLDERVTGPNQRTINGKVQRKLDRRTRAIGKLIGWVWARVIAYGIEHDGLPVVPGWNRCDLQPQPRITIDSGRESAQERADLNTGLMSRKDHYGARGKDWQKETTAIFSEDDFILAKAKVMADRYGLPLQGFAERFGVIAPAKVGQQPPKQD